MKTILFLFTILLFGLVSCSTRNVSVQQIEEEGVVINGVRWATRNVGAPGTFARNPESPGGFFTFDQAQNACPPGWRLPTAEEFRNLRTAGSEWTAKGRRGRVYGYTFGVVPNLFLPAAGHRRTTATAPNFSTAIPPHRRFRTLPEYAVILPHHVYHNRDDRRIIPRSPVGSRHDYHNRTMTGPPCRRGTFNVGTGFYWSSSVNSTGNAGHLWFRSDRNRVVANNNCANRFSVRCVAD